MKYFVLIVVFLLSSCYSYSTYKPQLEYTEAEVSIVFDRKGFRGINGWGWQMGTLCFEYDRYNRWGLYGWPEGIDPFEEWIFILAEEKGPKINSPYH